MKIELSTKVLLGNGSEVSILDLFGDFEYLVLYFYPKDNTPGCTKQACTFRDLKGDFAKAGAAIVGVSKDSAKSHQKFTDKFELNFPLISDESTELNQLFGVWQKKKFMGREYMGTVRSVFLLGKNGGVVHSIINAKAGKDEQTMLDKLAEISG